MRFDTQSVSGRPGFFRVGKATNGQWWFIDPEDKAFYFKGVTSANRAGTMGGRRARPGPYAPAVDAKYKDRAAFADAVIARLHAWGFNALGAWATEEFFDRGMPYTEITEFAYCGPQIKGLGIGVPDVFDPAWEKAIDEKARAICTPRRDSRLLVGYFTDNEMGWAQVSEEDIAAQGDPEAAKRVRPHVALLQHCMSLDENAAAYKAAWDFVMARHGNSMEQLSKDWGVELSDRAAIRKLTLYPAKVVPGDQVIGPGQENAPPRRRRATSGPAGTEPATRPQPKPIFTAGYLQDETAFSKKFAERYFHLSAEAIRKHDPNHLILGCRFGGPPGPAVLAAIHKEDVDVVSANNYRPNFYERMDIYYRGTGRPVLNGEFADTSGYFKINGKTREGMTRMGAQSLRELFTHPGVVGYTWYRWVQGDPRPDPNTGKVPADALSVGLVNDQDQPNPWHTKMLAKVNREAEKIRLGQGGNRRYRPEPTNDKNRRASQP